MNITGKVHEISGVINVTEKLKKRELILEYSEQKDSIYKEYLKIDFMNDKADLLNKFGLGNQVEVSLNLKGKEWTDKSGKKVYYNSLSGWSIKPVSGSNQAKLVNDMVGVQEDDLPF